MGTIGITSHESGCSLTERVGHPLREKGKPETAELETLVDK